MTTRQQDKEKNKGKQVPTPVGPLQDQYDAITERARQRGAEAARTSDDDELESPMPKALQDHLAYLNSQITALAGMKEQITAHVTEQMNAQFNSEREQANVRYQSLTATHAAEITALRTDRAADVATMESLRTGLSPIRGSSHRESTAANTKQAWNVY